MLIKTIKLLNNILLDYVKMTYFIKDNLKVINHKKKKYNKQLKYFSNVKIKMC